MRRSAFRGLTVLTVMVACTVFACSDKSGTGRKGDDPSLTDPDFDNATGGPPGDRELTGAGPSCARIDVAATRVIPTVWLVVDGSGSMADPYGSTTRWGALYDHLANPMTGLVQEMEGVVKFGLSIYQANSTIDPFALFSAFLMQAQALMSDGGLPEGGLSDAGMPGAVQPDPNCPTLTGPDPALNNFSAIQSAYAPLQPGGDTPTGEALRAIAERIADHVPAPDEEVGPQVIILATDGQPNGCVPPDPFGTLTDFMKCAPDPNFPLPDPMCLQNALGTFGYQESLDAAYVAREAGAYLYVISLAAGLADQMELQKIANVGLGLAEEATPGAEIFEPLDPAALRQTLRNLIGGMIGCQVKLEGKLSVEKACDTYGIVELNGETLGCDEPDGWQVIDAEHIQLNGAACDTWLGGTTAQIHAKFPCDVIRPI